MSAPTKNDPLLERLQHAFGAKRIDEELRALLSQTRYGTDPLDLLTEDAKTELVRRLIGAHRASRRYAAQNRKIYREREMEKRNVV